MCKENVPGSIYPAFISCIINHHLADTGQYNNIRQRRQRTALPLSFMNTTLNFNTNTHTPILFFAFPHPPLLGKGGDCYTRKAVAVCLLETTGALPALSFNNVEWTDACQNETATCRKRMSMYFI